MKKKILLFVAIVAMLVCVFAISSSAAASPEYIKEMTMGMTQVTLSDGTVCDLYDDAGDALCYYKDPTTGSLTSVKANDLVFELDGTKLAKITLKDGTTLSTTGAANANKMVVLNLRGTEITDFKNDYMFKNANNGLQYIFMPDSIENLISYAFGLNNTLIGCYFSENSNLKAISVHMFLGCSKLKYFNMPLGVTTIEKAAFSGCTSLGEMYIPHGVAELGVSGSNQSPFNGCTNMYFVNTPGEEKPDVYYIPSSVKSIKGEIFKGCQNLNSVIVFNENITEVSDGYALNNTKAIKVVFLGNMENLNTSAWTGNIELYFCNKADKSTSDFTKITCSHKKVFCFADGNTAHIVNSKSTVKTKADCVTNIVETTYCFCGAEIGTNEVENSALGHEFDVEKGATKLSSAYADYTKAGKLTVKCARCAEKNSDTEIAPIITSFQGISTKINGDGLTIDYIVNYEALEAYSTLNGVDVELGFVVSAYDKTGDKPLDNESAVKAPVLTWKHESDNSDVVKYTGLSFRLEGNWDQSVDLDGNGEKETSMKDIKFCMAGYIIDNGAISYINANGTGEVADFNSYNGVTSLE